MMRTSMAGYSSWNALITPGSQWAATLGYEPMVTWPVESPFISDPICSRRSSSCTAARATGRMRAPSFVGATPCDPRSSTGKPRSRSSALISWLTPEGV